MLDMHPNLPISTLGELCASFVSFPETDFELFSKILRFLIFWKHIITIGIFGCCINGVTDKLLKFDRCWVIVASLCF